MNYQIKLYYGIEDSESGIYHAFEARDPEADCCDNVEEVLANMLDKDADDPDFSWNSMYINLPDSLISRIKADGVREYLHKNRN